MRRPLPFAAFAAASLALFAARSIRAEGTDLPQPMLVQADPQQQPPPPPARQDPPPMINVDQPPPPPMMHAEGPPPPPRGDSGTALVFIGDDGGLKLQEIRALRGLVVSELRKRGVTVLDDVRSEGIFGNEAGQRAMREQGISRGFSIQVLGRLGQKIPLEVDELSPNGRAPIFSASLSAASIEESDVVVPRLVDAVLDRRPVEENAQLGSVTRQESQPFRKRPGEMHLSLGLVIPTFAGDDGSGSPFGLSLELFYEIEHFNLGVEGLFGSNRGLTAGGLFFEGNYLPIDGEISPFIGGGIGYMAADSNGGLGLKAQVGVEFLRLHQIRVLAGFEVLVPLFDTSDSILDGSNDGDPNRRILPMFFLHFSL